MKKLNCWEFLKCGREHGGARAVKFGVCPAAKSNPKSDGLNDGKYAGRICWAVARTLCGGKIHGDFAQKRDTCMKCEFFKLVLLEQKEKFRILLQGQVYELSDRDLSNCDTVLEWQNLIFRDYFGEK